MRPAETSPNNSMQRTALRAAADAERWAEAYEQGVLTLRDEFEAEMWRIHREARRATAGYDGRWFEGQLRQAGGVATAKRVLASQEIQSGFADMLLAGRVDLTVEALVSDPKWGELFTPEEIREAQRRLVREDGAPA